MKLWGKVWKDHRIIKDAVVIRDEDDTRTHKIVHALDELCLTFDLSVPIWLDSCIRDFRAHGKTRFYQDSFIEEISFDCLEIQILEE